MIEVRNLAFSYGQRPVLRDVSFVVSPGEVVSVVGSNGAGKTTLLKILSTVIMPDSGAVMMDGADAFSRPLKYRRQIGYLPEQVALYEDMTVKEYLHYRAELKGESVKRVRRRVGEAVELCQISDVLRSSIRNLSAGLRKRVALADVLLLRPRLLLLDDFLAGLDRGMRESMSGILSNAAAFSSVIVTGHEIEDFARWTTRFLVLDGGVVSATVNTAGTEPSQLHERLESVLGGGGR